MLLTKSEIRLLLRLLGQKVVVSPSPDFAYSIVQDTTGYSLDPPIGSLQAKLSVMLTLAKE
jgi:hypothetical protein